MSSNCIATAVCVFMILILVASSENPTCIECDESGDCTAPECFCCREKMDVPFSKKETPQIVFFTFDDYCTEEAATFYRQLFNPSRKNPNGCRIAMTLFVTGGSARLVSEFYEGGNEIASHTVHHYELNISNVFYETKTQRDNLASRAKIPKNKIRGFRSPYLKPAGDAMFKALQEIGYVYDSSLVYYRHGLSPPVSPFTLDFGWPYDTPKGRMYPHNAYPGIWEVPLNTFQHFANDEDCDMVDFFCSDDPEDEATAFDYLMDNFISVYNSTKMPFGVNMHYYWFRNPERLAAMHRFLDSLLGKKDVYIVTAWQTIEWLMQPTPLSGLKAFSPWQC